MAAPDLTTWDVTMGIWRPKYRTVEGLSAQPALAAPRDPLDCQRDALPRLKVVWTGALIPGQSLGNVSRESVSVLRRMGVNLTYRPLPGVPAKWLPHGTVSGPDGSEAFEIQVPHCLAGLSCPTVRFVHNEFGRLGCSDLISKGDAIWTPSVRVATLVSAARPDIPVFVVPLGVSTHVFRPEGTLYQPLARRDRFRFLYVGTTLSRKGFDLLWDAFRLERDNLPGAELVLRLQPDWHGWIWPEALDAREGVHLLTAPLSRKALAAVMRSCDVLVLPSRAEAFGMPVLEAMACGTPPIVPAGNAMDDFCPEPARFTVESDPVSYAPRHPGRRSSIVYRYIEPRLSSLRRAMLQAYREPALVAEKRRLCARIASHYSWERVTTMLLHEATKAVLSQLEQSAVLSR
jgi:glycosyltransferase involved in cell wall biosynthesis